MMLTDQTLTLPQARNPESNLLEVKHDSPTLVSPGPLKADQTLTNHGDDE